MTIIEYIDNVDDFTSYTRSVKIENHGRLPSTANVAIGNLIKIATNLSLPVLRLTYIYTYIHTDLYTYVDELMTTVTMFQQSNNAIAQKKRIKDPYLSNMSFQTNNIFRKIVRKFLIEKNRVISSTLAGNTKE